MIYDIQVTLYRVYTIEADTPLDAKMIILNGASDDLDYDTKDVSFGEVSEES